jgi:hypothetical protein
MSLRILLQSWLYFFYLEVLNFKRMPQFLIFLQSVLIFTIPHESYCSEPCFHILTKVFE